MQKDKKVCEHEDAFPTIGASNHTLHILFMASAMAPEFSQACQQLQVYVCVSQFSDPFGVKQHAPTFVSFMACEELW